MAETVRLAMIGHPSSPHGGVSDRLLPLSLRSFVKVKSALMLLSAEAGPKGTGY